MSNIEERLKRIICDYVDVDPDNIRPTMSLKFDIGLDSFGLISLICSIENEFSISIPDSELSSFSVLQDMVDYISANTNSSTAEAYC